MVKGGHASETHDDVADMHEQQRHQEDSPPTGKAISRHRQGMRQHRQQKSEGSENPETQRPGSAGLTGTQSEHAAQPGLPGVHQQQPPQDSGPTQADNPNKELAQHDGGQTAGPATAATLSADPAAATNAGNSGQASMQGQHSMGGVDTTGQFSGQPLAQEQAGDDDLDAAEVLAFMSGLPANSAAEAAQSMPMQLPAEHSCHAAAAAYGYQGFDYGSMMQYAQQYPLTGYDPAVAWPQLSQEQAGATGYSAAPQHSASGGGSKASKEYYRQKLADILREAGRVHELPQWDVHVSHRPKNGKPDAVYIAPDGTRYKSRAILRDALDLKPGPGARRAKVAQQQQLQAAMAATAAANAAAAAAAGDASLSPGAFVSPHTLSGTGLSQPAATTVSGSSPTAASFAGGQAPNAAQSPAAAAASGVQQQVGTSTTVAGFGPVWYEKVLQLTQTVVDSLEPAMRGQYKVIHILRCPVITGYVVEYCRRTTKGAIRNQLSGRITADGNITCGCTSKCNWQADIPSSMFEEHSGSTVRRPAQFIYIIGPQNAEGKVLENYNVTLKELLAFVNSSTNGASTSSESVVCVFTASKHCRHCMQCSEPGGPENGLLLECTGCPLAYHERCLGIERIVPAGAAWYCPYCLQAGRDPRGYRDSHLHRMCQQAVLNTRQIPKPPVVRQHHSGARALDQMSVPPPPPPLPGQQRPAYSTAETAVSTAAMSQQQQRLQHPAASSLSTGSAGAADSAVGAAGAGSADSKPAGAAAAVASAPVVKLEEVAAPAAASAAVPPAAASAAVPPAAAADAGASMPTNQAAVEPAAEIHPAALPQEATDVAMTEDGDGSQHVAPEPTQPAASVGNASRGVRGSLPGGAAAAAGDDDVVELPPVEVLDLISDDDDDDQQMLQQSAPLDDAVGGGSAADHKLAVVTAAADIGASAGSTVPVTAASQQQIQQWQWLQAMQASGALSGSATQQQQPVSSAADTATQFNTSQQQQPTRHGSSGNPAASGGTAPTYKLNAPKPRLPAAARQAAAAAAGADSANTAGDSEDGSAAAAGSAGGGGAGAASPSYTFKRRTPQDMRRMVVRNLHALIGPHTEAAWQEHIKRGTTRGAQPSQWQCEAFMAEVFGDKAGPKAALWPVAEELRPEGVMGYLARVIEWASGVSLTPEQVNDCFVAGEHVWKVNDEKLALLGLYPWNWTLPLDPEQVATTSSQPTREELAPVASAAVAAAAAKLVAAMTNRNKPPSPAPAAAAAGTPAMSAPSAASQLKLQTPSASAPASVQHPVSSNMMQQQFAVPASLSAPAVRPSTSDGSAGAVMPSPAVSAAVTPAGLPSTSPSASYVSAAPAIPGLPMMTPSVPSTTAATISLQSSQTLHRLFAAGIMPVVRPGQAAAPQSGQFVMPVASKPAAATPASAAGLAPGMGVKVLQGMPRQPLASAGAAAPPPAMAVKLPGVAGQTTAAVVPTTAVAVASKLHVASRPGPTSSSQHDASSQGAALVAALQRAGASAQGATAAAAAVGLLPPQQTAMLGNAGGATAIKLEPQQQQQQQHIGDGSGAKGGGSQQSDPLAAAKAAVAARKQQLQAQRQQQPAVEGRDTMKPETPLAGDPAAPHTAGAAAQEHPMVQDGPEAVETLPESFRQLTALQRLDLSGCKQLTADMMLVDDSCRAAGGADVEIGSLDIQQQSAATNLQSPGAAAAGNVADGSPSSKQTPRPVEVKRTIARQLRVLLPAADSEYQAVCDYTFKRLKEHLTSTDLDLFLQKVVGPETGSSALPWPAEELRLGSMEEGAAVYMAKLLGACSGKEISSEEYKKCVTKQGSRWAVVEDEFRSLGITPWIWSVPLNQHVPAVSDLSVTLEAAQAAVKAARQAAANSQAQTAAIRDPGQSFQAQYSVSAGEHSEQTLVSYGRAQLGMGPQPPVAATALGSPQTTKTGGELTWGAPPPARPPSKAAASGSGNISTAVPTANTDAHVQKLRHLNQLMKRKYSLDQEDQEDPLVKAKSELAAVELALRKLSQVQQLRQYQGALAVESQQLASVRDTKRTIVVAQEQLRATMVLKDQQHQQQLQRFEQDLLEVLEPGMGDALVSEGGAASDSSESSVNSDVNSGYGD